LRVEGGGVTDVFGPQRRRKDLTTAYGGRVGCPPQRERERRVIDIRWCVQSRGRRRAGKRNDEANQHVDGRAICFRHSSLSHTVCVLADKYDG
jgi:hypothetical protein